MNRDSSYDGKKGSTPVMSRRELLKWLAAGSSTLALGGLAGCVAPPELTAPTSTPVPPAPTAAAEPDAAAATGPEAIFDFIAEAAKPYQGTEINYLAINSAQTKDIEPYLGEFEDLTGIKVTSEYGGENEVLTKLELELTSGSSAYDALHVFSQAMPRYAAAGWLTPLNSYIDDPAMTNKEWWMPDDFYASTIKQLSDGDTLLAVPLFIATQIFYYRKDIFEQNGITELPQTFDDLWQVCEKIDGKPIKAIALRGTRGPTMNVWDWTAWLFAYGGEYFKSYDAGSPDFMKPSLDDPKAIEAADFYAQVIQNFGPEGSVNWGWQEAARAFKQGQTAMIQEGSPFGAQFMDPAQSQVADENMLGCFLIPEGPAARSAPSASHGWSIPQGSKKKEAAWLFIEWASAPALQYRTSIEQPRAMVPRASVWAKDAYKEKYGWDQYIETVDAAFKVAGEWPHYLPPIPEWTDVGSEASRFLQEVIAGERPAAEALPEANQVIAKIMEDAGYYS
jgi:ABC-type glycerol-3-phosphate transport system substrate-binding protein